MATPKDTPQGETAAAAPAPAGLLDKIVLQGRMVKDVTQQSYARELLEEFANQITGAGLMTIGSEQVQVLPDGMTIGPDTISSLKDRIAQIDKPSAMQLNEIMHDPEFQHWKPRGAGCNYLVMNSRPAPAQDPGAEHHEEGASQRHGEGHRVRPERDVQEGLRRRVRHVRRQSLSACWSATTNSAGTRRILPCWRRSRTSPRPRTRRSSRQPSPSCSTGTASPN